MATSRRSRMPVADRAKQFMPFSPLKGLEEALSMKERIVQPRKVLSEEMAAALNRQLLRVRKGDVVRATYYWDGAYLTEVGRVALLDAAMRTLSVGNIRIAFDDLLSIGSVAENHEE